MSTSFPNTYGGRVTVRNTPPLPSDTAPSAGSLVAWDAFPPGSTGPTTVSTVGGTTLTNAALWSRAVIRSGTQTGAFSDTTDTANSIINALPYKSVGANFACTFYNTTGYTQTLSPGSGVTFIGNLAASASIVAGSSKTVTFIASNIGSPAVNALG